MGDEVVPAVVLIRGEDSSLVAQKARKLSYDLVGDEDRVLVVEEHSGEEINIAHILDDCRTPPFLSSKRVVIVREVPKLEDEDIQAISDFAKETSDFSTLILLQTTKSDQGLIKALKNSALVIETGISNNQKVRSGWLKEEIAASHVKLDAQAIALIQEHLGEDLSRLAPLLETLEAAFGPTKHLNADEILPFLGSSGSTPPWALADAMDTGDSKTALIELHRLLNASSRHPLAVLALLERHFDQPLRLQGVNLTTREEAAQYLGNIHPFVAQKAMARSRRLGFEGLHRAITLLADADYDLRGISGLSGESVLEILVARLSQLSKTTSRR